VSSYNAVTWLLTAMSMKAGGQARLHDTVSELTYGELQTQSRASPICCAVSASAAKSAWDDHARHGRFPHRVSGASAAGHRAGCRSTRC